MSSYHAERFLNHHENRKKVCLVCFEKAKYPLTAIIIDRIHSYFIEDYDQTDQCFPNGICAKCRSDLLEISNGKKGVDILPTPFDFAFIVPFTTQTRSDCGPKCFCPICKTARLSGKNIPKRKKGHPSANSDLILPIRLCGSCKSPYGRGKSHKCSVSTLRNNLREMCSSLDKNTQELLAASVIKSCDKALNEVALYSGGPNPLRVCVGASKALSTTIDVSEITKWQNTLSASNNEMKRKVIPFVRSIFGRDSVASNIVPQLQMRDKRCSDFFDCISHEFESYRNEEAEMAVLKPVIFCIDVPGFIDMICSQRDINQDEAFFKIGIDSGGGFIKYGLNIYEKNTDSMPQKLIDRPMLNTSVKKLVLLAIAYNVDETYENVRYIMELLMIKQVDFNFFCAVDLKMANILSSYVAYNRIQAHFHVFIVIAQN